MVFFDEELLRINPQLEQIFQDRGSPLLPIPTRQTIASVRKKFAAGTSSYNRSAFARQALGSSWSRPSWEETDRLISVRDGTKITIRTYVPKSRSENGSPVAVVFHGGGWCTGSLETEEFLCRILASKIGLVVVNVDYRLYPDVEFPIPVTDCYDAVKWVSQNASIIGGDPLQGFLVGGVSLGATCASVATYLARDDGLSPSPTGCFLFCPAFYDEFVDESGIERHLYPVRNRSLKQHEDAPLMNRAMQLAVRSLANHDMRSPLLSPFFFPHHRNLPPTYIQVCGLDLWRDSGFIYEELLRAACNKTKVNVYPGLPHCWWINYPQIKATKDWLDDVMSEVKWLLSERSDNFHGGSRL